MNSRALTVAIVIVAGAIVVAVVARPSRDAAGVASSPKRSETHRDVVPPPAAPAVERVPIDRPRVAAARAARTRAAAAAAAPQPAWPQPVKTPPAAAPVSQDAPKPKKEKPLERQALAYVGMDPLAESIWLDAINSPDVSAHDRSDLIEDLNEDGFADLKNLTRDDLPLIVNRLSIIEREAPYAMDEVNAAAFAEAYKDLLNMYAKAMRN